MLEFIENSWKTECGEMHDSFARAVNDTVAEFKLKSILEIGCGTGEVARRLKGFRSYMGIDSNEECINLAIEKCIPCDNIVSFEPCDVRKLDRRKRDLVCAFSILKHFGLHEWDAIFKKICSLGKFVIFNMPIAEETHDDGTEFHHVWMTLDQLYAAMYTNGLVICRTDMQNPIEPIFICRHEGA